MNKFITTMAITLSTLAATTVHAASKVTCVDRDIQDASFAATFTNVGAKKSEVDLFIPEGESGGKNRPGFCTPDKGADELAITCQVLTSTESGYEVRLYSEGSPRLKASVTPWSMQGPGKPTILPCDPN